MYCLDSGGLGIPESIAESQFKELHDVVVRYELSPH